MSYISEALSILNLLDEGTSSRSSINSNLRVMLTHMLKCKYQPEYENKASWINSIWNSYIGMTDEFISIGKGNLYKNFYMKQMDLNRLYKIARKTASLETNKSIDIFPEECEWTRSQLSDLDFIQEFIDIYGKDSN